MNRYAWVILVVVYLAGVVTPLNQFKVPPIMPVLMEAFKLDLTQAGLLMSILALVGLVLSLPAGLLLQRYGSKTIGLIALGCTAAGSAIGVLSQGYLLLLSSRVMEGIGIGLIGVVGPATLAMWFPPARQGAPMGIWATGFPVGSVLMYILAPAVANTLGWRAVWWLGAGIAVLLMIVYGLSVHNPPDQSSGSSGGQSSLDLRRALANRNIWFLAAGFACLLLAMSAIGTYYPTFLSEERSYPLGQAALISSIGAMAIIVIAPLAGWFSDRIGSRRLVFSLPFLVLAVLMLLPFRATGWQVPAVMLIQGIVSGSIPTAVFAAVPEIMHRPEWAGIGLAVLMVGQSLGSLAGPVLFGGLVENLGWILAGYLMIPVCLLGFICCWMVRIR